MSLKLKKSALYKNRIWDHASTKASQYYKGRKNKLDLSYVKQVTVRWNPLLPKSGCARWFRRTVTQDEFTQDSAEVGNCKIIDELHDRKEHPYMEFLLKTPQNTTVHFDIRRWQWIPLVQEMKLWCDYARRINESDVWSASEFEFQTMRRQLDVSVKMYDANDAENKLDPVMEKLPELRMQHIKQRWCQFFEDDDQPLQMDEFIGKQSDEYSQHNKARYYPGRMKNTRITSNNDPKWSDDLRKLHWFEEKEPNIVFDYIVTDDLGLVYPQVLHIPSAQVREQLLGQAGKYTDYLSDQFAKRDAAEGKGVVFDCSHMNDDDDKPKST